MTLTLLQDANNAWYDARWRRARTGPRWEPQWLRGTCCACGTSGEAHVVWWMGLRYCAACVPDLPRALMEAPVKRQAEATEGQGE